MEPVAAYLIRLLIALAVTLLALDLFAAVVGRLRRQARDHGRPAARDTPDATPA